MKIVFCLLHEQGHINPYIGPGQALQDMGHQVTVISMRDIAKPIQDGGLEFRADLVNSNPPPELRGKELVELFADQERYKNIIKTYFLSGIEEQIPHYIKWFLEEKPDALVIDSMNYAAGVAALKLKIPWVSMSSSLASVLPADLRSPILEVVESLSEQRDEIFRKNDVEGRFRAVDCLSPHLNITFATQAFIKAAPEGIELVGPSLPIHSRGDEAPGFLPPEIEGFVYASFGSQMYFYPETYRKILAACKALQVPLVMSIGDLLNEPEWGQRTDAILYRYAPQLEILKKAALFITHGGANSVAEGIQAGTPFLVNPLCNDQFHQAAFIERANIGLQLDLQTASVGEIQAALQHLLVSRTIRGHMNDVSQTYQANGALKAAHLITERLIPKSKR